MENTKLQTVDVIRYCIRTLYAIVLTLSLRHSLIMATFIAIPRIVPGCHEKLEKLAAFLECNVKRQRGIASDKRSLQAVPKFYQER